MSNDLSVSSWVARPGLSSAKRALRGIFERKSTVHAVLLYGEEGAGKSAIAEALAQFWLCTQPNEVGACGECRACGAFLRGNSGDLLRVAPWGLSRLIKLLAIHETNMRQADEGNILPIQTFLRTLPIQGRHKVVLMADADRMGGDASKALLKTLEEPEPHARFVLMTTHLSRVETTIRSRCLIVPCELPSPQEWEALTTDAEPWERDLAQGAPGMLARIRRNPDPFREIWQIVQDGAGFDVGAALACSERFRKAIETLQKAEETNARTAGAAALKALGAAAEAAHLAPKAIQRIAESHRRILGNANPTIEFDALFSRLLAEK